jgi:hypothetical protein
MNESLMSMRGNTPTAGISSLQDGPITYQTIIGRHKDLRVEIIVFIIDARQNSSLQANNMRLAHKNKHITKGEDVQPLLPQVRT